LRARATRARNPAGAPAHPALDAGSSDSGAGNDAEDPDREHDDCRELISAIGAFASSHKIIDLRHGLFGNQFLGAGRLGKLGRDLYS
jgi:hypothetical protein